MKILQIKVAGVLLCVYSSLALASTENLLPEIVVTAARMPQSLDKTIADTTVLNEQDIRKSGVPDVPALSLIHI